MAPSAPEAEQFKSEPLALDEAAEVSFSASGVVCTAKPRLAIVGNGMVGHHFCAEAHRRGLTERYALEVYGEEPTPAYDRVNLSKILEGVEAESLWLASQDWYRQRGIAVHFGTRIEALDTDQRQLRLANGRWRGYDWLVLATGSRPRVPQVDGVDLPGVLVYRTVEDACGLRDRVLQCKEGSLPVVVVGGGLLGLELAEQVCRLGAAVVVVENERSLLPRQLDPGAGAVLQRCLEAENLSFRLDFRVAELKATEGGTEIHGLSAAEPLGASLVVFAIGVTPRDELARAAKLQCDLFGGVQVDSALQTSNDRIYAIGECVRFQGDTYGLVAPGYRMAEVLVDRLLGGTSSFEGAEPSTRLKTAAVDVMAVGESASHGMDVHAVVYERNDNYRRLTVRGGRVVGASCIGAWDQLPAAQQAVARGLPLRWWEEKRFQRDRPIWGGHLVSPATWPDTAVVCGCTGVTCGALRVAREAGCESVDELVERTGAGGGCGSCRLLLESLCNPQASVELSRSSCWLLAGSVAALVVAAIVLVGEPIPYGRSVRGLGLDALWRDSTIKQITGYSLAGLMATGGVFSLRKRWPRLRWASFGAWRALHAWVGVLTVVFTIAHTGLRLGVNLDAALMGVFLACTLLGTAAGFVTAFESRLPPGTGTLWRKRAGAWHLLLVWPLPLLVLFHALKFYYF